jgi:hypothetical protein
MDRAQRRKHLYRLREKRKNYVNSYHDDSAHCSCSMCGNVRRNKWNKNKEKFTKQEKCIIITHKEEIED